MKYPDNWSQFKKKQKQIEYTILAPEGTPNMFVSRPRPTIWVNAIFGLFDQFVMHDESEIRKKGRWTVGSNHNNAFKGKKNYIHNWNGI